MQMCLTKCKAAQLVENVHNGDISLGLWILGVGQDRDEKEPQRKKPPSCP